MTFKEYYENIKIKPKVSPATSFILDIAEHTMRSERTIRQWLSGCQEPPFDIKRKISEYLSIPIEELFPQNEEII